MDYLSVSEDPVISAADQSIASLKRPISLGLKEEEPLSKRRQLQQQAQALLASPDLNFLKLNSPELEKMLMTQSGMMTPTPSQLSAITKAVTEEQDNFARGFLEALNNLHKQNQQAQQQPAIAVAEHVPDSEAPASTTFTELQTVTTLPGTTAVTVPLNSISTSLHSSQLPTQVYSMPSGAIMSVPVQVSVKQEESQIVPQLSSSPELEPCAAVPVNLQNQELMKVERKRARNREAARRCRNRKLDRISTLEERVQHLNGENGVLSDNATKLREEVCKLKEQILQHIRCGCQIMVGPNMKL